MIAGVRDVLRRLPAWLVPAVVAALLTATVVITLNLRSDSSREQAAFPRQRVPAPASAPTTTAPAVPTPAQTELSLENDGLGLVDFGQPAQAVVRTLTARLGTPDENYPERCRHQTDRETRWIRWADLSIRVASDRFRAYIEGVHVPPGGPPWRFATDRDVAPGDPATRLKKAYGTALQLGPQHAAPGRTPFRAFTVGAPGGGISGVLESQGATLTVASIYAGDFC